MTRVLTEIVSPGTSAHCIIDAAEIQVEKLISDEKFYIKLLKTELKAKGTQISNLLMVSGSLGAASVGYFMYRLKDIKFPGITLPKMRKIPDFEELPRIYNRGGKRSKKNRKSRKSKKNKRKTRKNRRHSRKH
jgi:hypothetical protein